MYIFNGKKLTEDQAKKFAEETGRDLQTFLEANPDIQEDPDFEVKDEAVVETTESEGKTPTTETDTTVDVTEVSDTGSPSADGSLEYTDVESYEDFYRKGTEFTEKGGAELRQTAGGTLEPLQLEEVVVTGEDKTKQKQARDSQIAISELSKASKIPETAITMGAGIAATTVDIAKGFLELTDKYGVAPINYAIGRALGYDTTLRKEADASIENYAAIEDVTNLLREYTLRKYDSKGNEQDVYGLIEQGNYTDAAELAANQGFSAAPYLALSIASPVYGSALIGASVTGQEVVEGLKNRPEATLSEIYGASLLKGGVEFATNAIGGGIQRGVLGIGKKLGATNKLGKLINPGEYKKAVDIYTKTYLGKVADVGLGLTKGGATNFVEEASASIGNAIVDKTVYGQEYDSLVRNAVNDGIVGLALGAPIGGAGGFKSIASKQQALEFLAPKKWTQDLAKQSMRLAEAQFNLDNAPTNKKEKFQKKAKKIESIIEMKKQQLYSSFDGLTKKEKIQYAENLDKIDSALGEIGNKRYTKGQQEDAQKELEIATKQNEALVGTELFDAKIEENISKVLKNRELIAEAEEKAKGIKKKDLKIVYLESADGEQDAIFEKTVDGKTTIYVNKRVAEQTGQTNVLGHELLHYITNNAFETDNASVAPLVESFKDYLKETQPDIHRRVQERIDANYTNEDGSIKEGALEEYFNVFSDLVAKEKIVVDESFADKIKNSTKKFLNGLGFSGVKLDTGKDVFDFIRSYQDNISDFKFKQLDIALESSKLKSKKDKQVVKESRSTVLEAINKLVPSTVKTKEEFQSPKVFNLIYESVIKEGGAINNYIKSRATSKQEAEKAIESVSDRLLNFDPEALRKEGKAVGAEAFGEFIFANTNFGKMVAKKALFKEGEKAGQEIPLDAPEATTQLADEVSIDETKVKSTTSKLRRVLGIKQDDAIYDLAKEVSGEILSGDLPGKKVKTAINKEARKSKLRKAVSDLMGTEKAIDEQFLNKNILEILKALPASDLVKLEREAKVKVLAEQGPRLNVKDAREAVNKGLLPKDTNLQSGPKVSSKLPTTLEQAKEFFTQKRKAGLVNVVTEMLVKDAAPEVTKGKMEPAKRAKVLSEIDRAPTLKFSLSTKQDLDWSIDEAENRNTSFAIGDKTYNVQLNAKDLGADQDADPTDYSLEFDQDGSQELTGKGDQFKAVSIIYNGLIDEIKSNPNIATISFNALASETSRVKLYDVLLDKLSTELGWTAEKFDYESDGVVDEIGFEMYKPEETAKEEPTLKFSKAINGLEGKNQSNFFNKLPITVEQIKALDLSIPNKSVLDEIQNILKDNLGQKFPKTKEISKDLFKVLSLYNKIDKQFKNANTALPITLEEMLFDSLKASEENTNLLKFLKIKGNLSNYYTVENINKQRQIPVEIATKMLSEGKSKEEVIKFLTLAKGMYASSSKIGKGNFKVVDGLVVEVFEGDQDYSFGSQRYQVFDSVKDYEDNVINQITGLKPTKIKLFPDTSKSAISDRNYEGRLDQAKDFRGVVDTIMLYMTDGIIDSDLPYTKVDLALVMAAMKSNMSAPLKKAANLKWIFEGGNIDVKDLRYEHLIPTNYMMLNLLDVYLNNKGNERTKKANELFKEYTVAVIPRSMDDTITDVGLQDVMNSDYKTGEDPISRYYNLRTFGNEFMFALKSIDPKDDGKIVGQEWANISKDKAIAAEKNNINLPAEDRLSQNTEYTNKDVLDKTKEKDKESLVSEMKFSKSLDLNKDFNDIIENKTGIASDKTYARVKAEVAGANKGKFNFFIPPSAEDFVGLLYSTLGKGSTGDAQMAWYKAHLLNPFARAMENLANDRANMMQDFRGLKKALKIVPKNLRKKIKDSNFTKEQAVRAYIWDKQGMEIPGLSQKDQQALVDFVNEDVNLTAFADQLIAINKGDAYAAPDAGWVAGTIDTDFIKALNTTKRSKYLEVWQQNVDQIFSEANLNKLEAAYGANYREAMVDMLKRMETGRNTSSGSDRLAARFTDWLTNSVGAIMFFNTRSAVLQTISAVNFINFSDNNVLKAGQAFANQPQYWSDFKKLFNSPFLLDRRSGLKLNVNEADIAAMAKGPGNSARNVIAGILKAGFLPTQIADSFAIASGGASFYRNRIKALQKEGLTEAEAEEQAFRDFREIAEESQQSSRPDKISQQQAGPLGRVVLAFANTPAQYARLIKKAASDLKNGRGDAKTNISKIIYYGVAQNVLFSALQQALFAIAFDDEEEEEKKNEKYFNIVNGMSDSILRGIGVGGAVVSVVKNTALRLAKEADKKSPKYQDAVVKGVLQISPPVSSKVGKLQSAGRSFSWNQEEMRTRGWSIDNPAYLASANVISAATNVPLDRAVKKITNIVDAGNEDIEYYKRVALALGWSAWELGIDKKGGKVAPPKTNMDKLYDLNKKEQIDSLLSLGLSKKQIKLLKKEEDRVKAILDPKSIKKIKVSKRDSLFGLNKKDQVKALERLGLNKKEIRALRLESDRVEAIINKQKKEN
jgi:hypothetical protein